MDGELARLVGGKSGSGVHRLKLIKPDGSGNFFV